MSVRLALDWGKARIGVAACDAAEILAYPVTTISVDGNLYPRLTQVISEYQPVEIVLGLPISLRGTHEVAANQMHEIATRLVDQFGLPVRLVDERMTTACASKQLSAVGKSRKKQRSVIDQVAAVGILKQVIEANHRGQETGTVLVKEV